MENYFEYIQEYLEGALSPDGHRQFELELERNAALREETAHQRQLRATLSKHLLAEEGLPALRHTLQQQRGVYFPKTAPSAKRGRIISWLVSLAAAACLLVAFNFLGWFSTDFEQLPKLSMSVTRGAETGATYKAAVEAFNAGKYGESSILWERLVADDSTVVRHRFYLGLSYLGEADFGQAAAVLQPIADGSAVFAQDASYFMAVALWRMGNVDEAANYAKRVTEGNQYHKKAGKLLEKLAVKR